MQTLTTPLVKTVRRADRLAAQTPQDRNRYVDFLRAVSILAVVVGHWLIAAPYATGGSLEGVNMLAHSPWTQWLTWVFQVMPVFFAVGGYSNAASWAAAQRGGLPYGTWLAARIRRLTIPLIPLLGFWAVLGVVASSMGIDAEMLQLGSQAALVPVWFLAVYVVVTALSPVLINLWARFGWRSFLALAGAALSIDVAVSAGASVFGWVNFVVVWSAILLLGVAWRTGDLTGSRAGVIAVLAGSVVIGLVASGLYPIAMVGVPGAEASNNSPPTAAMVAFGTMQVASLLAVEVRARRLLEKPRAWTATVLINGSIMTLYLWHMTAMVLAIGAMLLAGGWGLGVEPSTAIWWISRPLWIAFLLGATVPFLVALGRFEHVKPMDPGVRPSASTTLLTVAATCIGLALLAAHGIGGWFLGVRLEALVLPVAAAGMSTRWAHRSERSRPRSLRRTLREPR